MSNYFRADADEWAPEHHRAQWSAANKAPRWWAVIDLAWMLDCGDLPSIRQIASAWGWPSSTAHAFVRETATRRREWDAPDPAPMAPVMAPWLTPAGDA